MVKFKVDDSNYNKIYPIGSIYMSINSTDPSELFGGEWEQIEDKFLLACGTTYANGSTGGSADAIVVEHTHNMAHTHNHNHLMTRRDVYNGSGNGAGAVYYGYNGTGANGNYSTSYDNTASSKTNTNSTGESGTGKNMPPYLAVYCWVRIA